MSRMLLGLLFCLSAGCSTNAGRLAGVGAVTGGLAGAAIGNDAKGALVGTAIGATTGAMVGDTLDENAARTEALIQQQMGRRMEGAVTPDDVIAMTAAGLNEGVITNHIRNNGVAYSPQMPDLIRMRDAGVSDTVVQALQTTGAPAVRTQAAAAPPIIVQERWIAPPPYFGFGYHRHACRPHRRHVGWGVHIHN